MSVFGVILVHIFPHSDWIQRDMRENATRVTPNSDTFHAVMTTAGACSKKHSTLENTRLLQMASWNDDGVTQMYGCKCSFGNNTA